MARTHARTHTHIHKLIRTRLDEGLGPRRHPLRDYTQHSHETDMPSAGFEPGIPESQRPQTHALDRAATYRVIQEESAILWEMIVCVILSKKFI